MRFSRVATTCITFLAAPAAAEFPYPTNPNPCAAEPAGECIQPDEFHRYLFLPQTEPPTLPNNFDSDSADVNASHAGGDADAAERRQRRLRDRHLAAEYGRIVLVVPGTARDWLATEVQAARPGGGRRLLTSAGRALRWRLAVSAG